MSLPYSVSPSAVKPVPAGERTDQRLAALKRFFSKFNCPAKEYAQHFLNAADGYSLDWRLLPSISYIESTGGKAARNNNIFGWNSGKTQFSSPAAGIYTVGYRLAASGLYRGKGLDALLATYNPNAGYGRKVKSVMRRISPSE